MLFYSKLQLKLNTIKCPDIPYIHLIITFFLSDLPEPLNFVTCLNISKQGNLFCKLKYLISKLILYLKKQIYVLDDYLYTINYFIAIMRYDQNVFDLMQFGMIFGLTLGLKSQSTALVMLRQSINLTTHFLGKFRLSG